MAVQDLLLGTLSSGSSGTSSGKEPLYNSMAKLRESFYSTLHFFGIIEAFVWPIILKNAWL